LEVRPEEMDALVVETGGALQQCAGFIRTKS